MRSYCAIALIAGLSLGGVGSASQATEPRSVKGLISEHCIECHRVPGFAEEAPTPDINAPDFQTIADNPKIYTTERLVAFLRRPHFPMRQLILSESDIRRLVAFIEGLTNGPSSAQ